MLSLDDARSCGESQFNFNCTGLPFPGVSIVVPCRNEKYYIEACLRSLLKQEQPRGGFEIIVADGMSDDGTREILQQLLKADRRLSVIDNPCQSTPGGMNAGIRHARGRYIAILGAHASYEPDYIRVCAEILDCQPEAWCSGGPIVSRAKGSFGRAVAVAMSHPVGVGNAKHRFPHYEGNAEGACFPMFRRETFEKVGLYDENLIRNQDDEFNLRVVKGGGKIFISPRARCEYYVRETPRGLFRQYFEYGYWRVAVLRKHLIPTSLRQITPVTFFAMMFVALIAGLCLRGMGGLTLALALPVAYAALLFTAGTFVALKTGPSAGLLFPFATATMHLAYASGFVWGLMAGKTSREDRSSDGVVPPRRIQ